jgi:hypothetical protein
MPGPVSDSRDPEFGTAANAYDVKEAIEQMVTMVHQQLGPELKNIVSVVNGPPGKIHRMRLSERQLRIVRFGLLRSLENW